MNRVMKRVIKWNAARYEREYSHPLTVSLLREEYTEWLTATKAVDKLDGLCDLVYVAMGAIWKADIEVESVDEAQEYAANIIEKHMEVGQFWPGHYISTYLDIMEYDNEFPLVESLCLIITAALTEMSGLGLSPEECVDAMLIVCDANDTKTITKTASDVKANVDKGVYFVPPEAKLSLLLEKANATLN